MKRLLAFDLNARRRAVMPGGAFAALADGLSSELLPLLQAKSFPIPEAKARLTRVGGRCPVHGVLLDFDPWLPHRHHCGLCKRDYQGAEHDAWWAMNAQLWTVERAVHAASLYLLRGDPAHAALAEAILQELASRYAKWPNRDNVLGPSRPFFSTYLESIWLLNACHALSLLETAGRHGEGNVIRALLLEPSAALIAEFPEGRSNRQVWNDIAILSAWTLLGREAEIARRLVAPASLPWLLEHGLLVDGTWYEGENYHLFAHRGLWYGVEWLRATGRTLSPVLDDRFHRGFLTPFAGVLPDSTLPARRDSQYAVSVRQWRLAEYCELGQAHRADPRIAALLARLYAPVGSVAGQDRSGRRFSTADAERHDAPGPLTRADLSWRGLLMARDDTPGGCLAESEGNRSRHAGGGIQSQTKDPLLQWSAGDAPCAPNLSRAMPSVCLPSQGLAVIRRDEGRVYVALEGGETGGGHGHPDRLALTVQADAERWLDDPGTGSYVERALHWYRSTLAHHAPLVNGASQQRRPARLLAFEDRGGAGWIRKRTQDIAPGVGMTRTVVVCDGHLLDVLEWEAEEPVAITLPITGAARVPSALAWVPEVRRGAGGLEDGFDFLQAVERARLPGETGVAASSAAVPPGALIELLPLASRGHGTARVWYAGSVPLQLLRADAPAPPYGVGTADLLASNDATTPAARRTQRHWLEGRGSRGRIVGVWQWTLEGERAMAVGVERVSFPQSSQLADGSPSGTVAVIETADGTISTHRETETGWQIALTARHAQSSIDLSVLESAAQTVDAGNVEIPYDAPRPLTERTAITVPPTIGMEAPSLSASLPSQTVVTLGEAHYRRSELPWTRSHAPSARLAIARTTEALIVRVSMRLTDDELAEGPPVSARWGSGPPTGMPDNPLDNERADVNVSGVQWYFTGSGTAWEAAGLVALLAETSVNSRATGESPDARAAASRVRCTPLQPAGEATPAPDCQWERSTSGWDLQLVWPLAALPLRNGAGGVAVGFQLVVNEAVEGRERRLGQLALGGGGGFSYLRGDRENPADALLLRFP